MKVVSTVGRSFVPLALAALIGIVSTNLLSAETLDSNVEATVLYQDPAVTIPADDGQHDDPIEWWYYTGHLQAATGERYGFQFVVFKGETANLVGFVSHFAITDNENRTFHFDQRIDLGPQDTPAGPGFDFTVQEWQMSGLNGTDSLSAASEGYKIDLTLEALKPAAIHDDDGFIGYIGGQYAYYYSRPRLEVTGYLTVQGSRTSVSGLAWFDHQWGDFQTFNEGGWDWFAIQLDNGRDLMAYVIRAPDGQPRTVDGSLVDVDGTVLALDQSDIEVEPFDTWTSPETGVTYPSGWHLAAPGYELDLEIRPTLLDQELDTTLSTGQIYWEGQSTVSGTSDGTPVTGMAYVELTGYDERGRD